MLKPANKECDLHEQDVLWELFQRRHQQVENTPLLS